MSEARDDRYLTPEDLDQAVGPMVEKLRAIAASGKLAAFRSSPESVGAVTLAHNRVVVTGQEGAPPDAHVAALKYLLLVSMHALASIVPPGKVVVPRGDIVKAKLALVGPDGSPAA